MKRRKESAAWKKPSRPSRKKKWRESSTPPPAPAEHDRTHLHHRTLDPRSGGFHRPPARERRATPRRYPPLSRFAALPAFLTQVAATFAAGRRDRVHPHAGAGRPPQAAPRLAQY